MPLRKSLPCCIESESLPLETDLTLPLLDESGAKRGRIKFRVTRQSPAVQEDDPVAALGPDIKKLFFMLSAPNYTRAELLLKARRRRTLPGMDSAGVVSTEPTLEPLGVIMVKLGSLMEKAVGTPKVCFIYSIATLLVRIFNSATGPSTCLTCAGCYHFPIRGPYHHMSCFGPQS
jgi:hypothetical protein